MFQVQKTLGRNITKSSAKRAVDAVLQGINNSLIVNKQLQLRGFGKFYVEHRGSRKGVNPKTNNPVKIPAVNIIKFKAGNTLKRSINDELLRQ